MEKPDNTKEIEAFEKIERYIQGVMKGEELVQFQKQIQQDETLASEVALYMDMYKSIQLASDKDLKSSISNVHQNLEADSFFNTTNKENQNKPIHKTKTMEVKHKKSNIGRVLSIAAGLALLLGAAFFLFQTGNPGLEEQFAKVYKPETKEIGKILDNLDGYGFSDPDAARKEELTKALTLYEKGDYEQARSLLVQHLEKYQEDAIGKFYLGLCLLNEGEYAKASTHLQPLIQDENFELYDESRWYLSMCYMMFDTPDGDENTIKILKQILSDTETDYKVEAEYNLDYMLSRK